jgi:hypothetical protein
MNGELTPRILEVVKEHPIRKVLSNGCICNDSFVYGEEDAVVGIVCNAKDAAISKCLLRISQWISEQIKSINTKYDDAIVKLNEWQNDNIPRQ